MSSRTLRICGLKGGNSRCQQRKKERKPLRKNQRREKGINAAR
jgi:hypothetical protein